MICTYQYDRLHLHPSKGSDQGDIVVLAAKATGEAKNAIFQIEPVAGSDNQLFTYALVSPCHALLDKLAESARKTLVYTSRWRQNPHYRAV